MVVDKIVCPSLRQIFNDASALTLFASRAPLCVCFWMIAASREARLSPGRPLTSAQLMLLNVRYQQIVRPIRRAYAEKRTRVNPASFLLADEREIAPVLETARQDRAGGDKHEIGEAWEPPRGIRVRTKSVSNISGAFVGRGWRYDAGGILAGAFTGCWFAVAGSDNGVKLLWRRMNAAARGASARERSNHVEVTGCVCHAGGDRAQ